MVNHYTLQVKGEAIDDFIAQAQDRQRNAQSKSLSAAWQMWREQLQGDQIAFESERISNLGSVFDPFRGGAA